MELNSDTGFRFQRWLKGKEDSPAYLFNEIGSTYSMVYGTGSAQLYVMSMLRLIDVAASAHMLHVLWSLPLKAMQELIEHTSKGDWHASKTKFEQVSNYWLKPSQKYSQQTTKSITGATLDRPEKAKSDKKLDKDKRSGKGEVETIERDGEVGAFYRRFGESPFALDDVIGGRATYFDDHGKKGRSKTTHGNVMKTSDLIYDAMIRRSCKFLLYDAINNKKRVVYLLDDLDLRKVAYLSSKVGIPESARIESGSSEGKVPICTTEIREIFRAWDYLGKHLKFYLGFEECEPPWNARHGQQKEWAAYAEHRATRLLKECKALDRPATEALELCRAKHAQDPAGAIDAYHAARPSRYTKAASLHTVTVVPEVK